MDLFSVVQLAKPIQVEVGTRPLKEGEDPVLVAAAGRTLELDLGEAGESSSVALEATPLQSVPSSIVPSPPVQPAQAAAEHVEEVEEAEEIQGLKRKRMRSGDGAATSRKKRHVVLNVESSSSDVASRPPSPDTSIPAFEQSAESPPQNSPVHSAHSAQSEPHSQKDADMSVGDASVGQLVEELAQVSAHQVSLVEKLRAQISGESSQSAQKDQAIALLESQLASAKAAAESMGSYAQKLAEEKMALMCQINQERAEAAGYKSSCHWAMKYLENGKNAMTSQLEEFGATVKSALGAQEMKLRKLSLEYDEELYPHLMSVIAERRWLISHGLRLAALSTLESKEVVDAFGEVVQCALERGKAEAVEKLHKAKLLKVPIEEVPNYETKAYDNLVAAMHRMKDLELPMIAELERDQDYPIDVIMAGLTLAGHRGWEAIAQPDYYLKPDASQLHVPVFVRPKDILNPFALEKEVPLKQVLEAHATRLAKKEGIKGKAVLCGVGAAHLPRSDGVPVSVATVARRDADLLKKLDEIGNAASCVGSSSLEGSHSF